MTVELFQAADRPDLVEAAEEMGNSVWPPYLATAGYRANWSDLYKPALARHQTIAVEGGEVVALANSVPFWWEPGTDLPDEGWDWVLEHGVKAAREGTPFDPWLRTHVSLGAKILAPAMRSMTATGTIEQWQKWTGLRFPETGAYAIAGALAPLKVDVAADRGVYIEPNFWMQHPL